LASRVAAGGAGAVHAARRAADLGPAGEAALVEAFDGATRDGRRRLVRALADLPAAPALLVRALAGEVSDEEVEILERGLAALGDAAVASLAALLSDGAAPADGRARAAAALGRSPSASAARPLVAALGVGDPAVRRAVVAGLVAR